MPRPEGTDTIWIATLALAVAAAVAVAASGPSASHRGAARGFQRALGGLGTGRPLDLSRCPAAFDLRTDSHCALRHGPRPGADPLCPDHGASVAGSR